MQGKWEWPLFGAGIATGGLLGWSFGSVSVAHEWINLMSLKDQWSFYGALAGVGGGIGAVVVGAMVNAGFNRRSDLDQIAHERKALRLGIRAEIASIVAIQENRQTDKMIESMIAQWESGADPKFALMGAKDSKREEGIPVFLSTVPNIGKLGEDVTGEVVRFHAIYFGVGIDVRALSNGEMDHLGPSEKARMMKKDLELWREAQSIAAELLKKL